MRVIAGTAGGRRLSAPAGSGTRPTTDRVREATFNALGSMGAIDGAVVLDAFAGSGALGIEALSRGAASCTFVERDRAALIVMEANLTSTGLDDRARVIAGEARGHLASTRVEHDLVLLDPPRDEADWDGLLALVRARVTPDAVVVVESDRPIVGDAEVAWEVAREKRYGGTVVQMVSPRPSPPRQVGSP